MINQYDAKKQNEKIKVKMTQLRAFHSNEMRANLTEWIHEREERN